MECNNDKNGGNDVECSYMDDELALLRNDSGGSHGDVNHEYKDGIEEVLEEISKIDVSTNDTK